MKNRNEQSPPDCNPPRKPYHQPKLEEYGDLRAITHSRTTGTNIDGGMAVGLSKTN